MAWDKAGELGVVCRSREGEPCLGKRGGAAAGIPKLLPPAIMRPGKLKIHLMDLFRLDTKNLPKCLKTSVY